MIAWFVKNPVAANLLMCAILVGGAVTIWSGVSLEVFPPEKSRTVNVSVTLIGATPEDVELGVAVRIEQAVRDLEGIDRIITRANEGRVSVQVEALIGYDPRILLEDVKARVDSINAFPDEAERPVVGLDVDTYENIAVIVSGPQSEEEIRSFAEQIRLSLLQLEGITHVELESAKPYEIAVEVNTDKLREYDLSIQSIAQLIDQSSRDLSAGNVRAEGGDILIRSKGQAYRKSEFENIVIKTNPEGTILRIGDIATVSDGFEEDGIITRFNGNNAVFVAVFRVGDQNAINVSDSVKAYIDSIRPTLPHGMSLDFWDDESTQIRNSLGIMLNSALQGSVLVILLLSLFLRPSVAAWVFLGIPVSFIGAFLFLDLSGMSLNLMSAFGFILVLGIVVDDAIVTGENVFSHLRSSTSGAEAAINGTKEVSVPVTFGILTTVIAFVPLAIMDGFLGEFFRPVAYVVIPVLLLSLVESKLVLPAHLRHLSHNPTHSENRFTKWQNRIAVSLESAIEKYYKPILDKAISYRYATLALFAGVLLIIFALVLGGWTRWVFFPASDSETATASITMPPGTPFEITDGHVQRIASAAAELQTRYIDSVSGMSLITNIISTTGVADEDSRSNVGEVQFEMVARESRSSSITTSELTNEWREIVGPILGAESTSFRANFLRPGDPINVQLSGNSLEELGAVGNSLMSWLNTQSGVFDVSDSLSNGKEEIQVELKPLGHMLGITRADIVGQISQAYQGLEAQRIQRGQDEVRVVVRFPIEERRTFSSLHDLQINFPDGSLIPLANLAELRTGRGPSEITRIDQNRVLNVTADVDKESVSIPDLQLQIQSYLDDLLIQYPSIFYSFEGEDREEEMSINSLTQGLIIALGVIYCLLALPLMSYIQPLIVMSIIPFGLIGAVIGHWIFGYPLSITSLLGMVALIGVVINDSLVLVDFTNKRLSGGESLICAVRAASIRRFRPVMLTSLTTFIGLTPLLFERSTTSELLKPMAVSLGFGILFATLITLILVPIILIIVNDIRTDISNKISNSKLEFVRQ